MPGPSTGCSMPFALCRIADPLLLLGAGYVHNSGAIVVSPSILAMILPLTLYPIVTGNSVNEQGYSRTVSYPTKVGNSNSIIMAAGSAGCSIPTLNFGPLELVFDSLRPYNSVSGSAFPPLVIFPFTFAMWLVVCFFGLIG